MKSKSKIITCINPAYNRFSSLVFSNVSPGIEPVSQNLYIRKLIKNEGIGKEEK